MNAIPLSFVLKVGLLAGGSDMMLSLLSLVSWYLLGCMQVTGYEGVNPSS